MSEEKYTYRLPPCPWYEVESVQAWLEDMAGRGLVLEKDGFFLGLASFRKTVPQKRKYRLEAVGKKQRALMEEWDGPGELELELAEDFGWEYVARRDQFYIYTTEDEKATEMHTDPAVAAIALKRVVKQQRWNLVDSLFWTALYPLWMIRGGIISTMLAMGTVWSLAVMGLLLAKLVGNVVGMVHLHRLRSSLAAGQPPEKSRSWRSRGKWYIGGRVLALVLVCACVGNLLCVWSDDLMDVGRVPLQEFAGEPPFAAMAELLDGDFSQENYGFSNTVRRWSEPVAPENWEWDQIGRVKRPNGTVISGGLDVQYHVLANGLLARHLAWECYTRYRLERNFELLELELPQVDYAVALRGQLHFDTVILRHGSKVLVAQFYQTSETRMPLEQWAAVFAEGLV